jgi:hypothetical protein
LIRRATAVRALAAAISADAWLTPLIALPTIAALPAVASAPQLTRKAVWSKWNRLINRILSCRKMPTLDIFVATMLTIT